MELLFDQDLHLEAEGSASSTDGPGADVVPPTTNTTNTTTNGGASELVAPADAVLNTSNAAAARSTNTQSVPGDAAGFNTRESHAELSQDDKMYANMDSKTSSSDGQMRANMDSKISSPDDQVRANMDRKGSSQDDEMRANMDRKVRTAKNYLFTSDSPSTSQSTPSVSGGILTPPSSDAGTGAEVEIPMGIQELEAPPPYSLPEELLYEEEEPGTKSAPKLEILMIAVGDLDEVQQFASVAVWLRNKHGHRIRVATHPEFKGMIQGCGFEFVSLGGSDDYSLRRQNSGHSTRSSRSTSTNIGTARLEGWKTSLPEVLSKSWAACLDAGEKDKAFIADAIVSNPQSFGHVHFAEKLGIPVHLFSSQPWTPTRAFPHPLAVKEESGADRGQANLATYAAVDKMLWREAGEAVNRFRKAQLGLEPMDLFFAAGLLQRLKVPATYLASETLPERPQDWDSHIYLGSSLEEVSNIINADFFAKLRTCPLMPGSMGNLQSKKRPALALSPTAAVVLVKVGILKLDEIEPYRSQEYDVIRPPTDPLTGLASATQATVVEMAMGLAAGPREAYNQMKPGDANATPVGLTKGIESVTVSTTKGIGSIITASLKTPVVITDGLTRGFHNAPRLYGDDTVREEPKVKGWRSGFVAAGKELTYGMYDGLTGFVTQPINGAKKEGGIGLLKGMGKGIGGLVFKPAAGAVGVGSYAVLGIYKELQKIGRPDTEARIVACRLARGEEAFAELSQEEKKDIPLRYLTKLPQK